MTQERAKTSQELAYGLQVDSRNLEPRQAVETVEPNRLASRSSLPFDPRSSAAIRVLTISNWTRRESWNNSDADAADGRELREMQCLE
jgi:hypothetical protein